MDGIVRIRPDFARHLSLGDAEVQVLVHGTDANQARIIQVYAQGAVGQWAARRAAEGKDVAGGPVIVHDRLWFNEANDSHYFLVPGLIVLVMTLIGALLTAMVMAREWERGTLEACSSRRSRSTRSCWARQSPISCWGWSGWRSACSRPGFCSTIPFRGSVWVLAGGSMLYLLVALGIGLLISSAIKSQFVASQVTMLVTLPAGVHALGVPVRLAQHAGRGPADHHILPARYYVALLQTVFLAGDVWGVIVPNAAVLAVMAAVVLLLSRAITRKKLD